MKSIIPRGTTVTSDGQGKIEYALLLALVAVVVIAALLLLGPTVGNVFSSMKGGIESTPPPETTGEATGTPEPEPTAEATTELGDQPTPDPSETGEPREISITFFDDFDGSSESEWLVTRGENWRLEDGSYFAGPDGEGRAFAGNPDWTDYAIETTANLKRGNGYGIYFRATNLDKVDGYIFQYDPGFRVAPDYPYGAFLFRKVEKNTEVGGWKNFLNAVALPSNYDWYNQNRTIRIDVRDDTFVASVDGQEILKAQDSQFSNGAIGLRTWSNSEASFDYVKVTP